MVYNAITETRTLKVSGDNWLTIAPGGLANTRTILGLLAQSLNLRFAQDNPTTVRIQGLHVTSQELALNA